MRAATITDFRANIASMLDGIEEDHVPLIITRTGRRSAVVIAQDDWDSINETLYLLSSRANAERLLRSVAAADAGDAVERALTPE